MGEGTEKVVHGEALSLHPPRMVCFLQRQLIEVGLH